MPEYMDKVDALTKRQKLFLSGCHLDKESTEEGKTNESHQEAVLGTLKKSLEEYRDKYPKYMK